MPDARPRSFANPGRSRGVGTRTATDRPGDDVCGPAMTVVLFWDIDGTLLSTARAGIFAWEDAISEVLGTRVSLQDYRTAGLTDVEIARLLVEEVGQRENGGSPGPDADPDPDPSTATRLLRRYEDLLPSRLHYRRGSVMPGIIEILDRVRQREDMVSMLLTGNTAAGALAKLTHYGLIDYFGLEADASMASAEAGTGVDGGQPRLAGSFADGAPDRPAIARQALRLARQHVGAVDPRQTFVIGDTPHDIDCGRAIEAWTIAVATGVYELAELARHDPWWAVERLPDPKDFLAKLEAVRCG